MHIGNRARADRIRRPGGVHPPYFLLYGQALFGGWRVRGTSSMADTVRVGPDGETPVNPYSLLEAVNNSSDTSHTAWLIFLAIMTYLMILVAFLGFGYNLINNRHVRMTALVEKLSSRAKDIVRLITSIIALVYFCFLMFAGVKLAMDSFETGYFSQDTGLLIGPWQTLMCIGVGVLLVACVVYILNLVKVVAGRQNE